MPLAAPPARLTCPHCLRPQRSCLCRWITPTANELPLLILQHPREQRHAKGTARLLQLSLRDSRCEVGERFAPDQLAQWLAGPRAVAAGSDGVVADAQAWPPQCLLLYPESTQAADAAEPQVAPGLPMALPLPVPGAWRLVLLDGSWRHTRKLLHLNPLLQRLPRWPLSALAPLPASRYLIRKAQRPEQRSTIEAACLALGQLEGQPARYAPLLAAFDGWVAATRAGPSA